MSYPKRVVICECAARDGLQHEPNFVPTATKVSLIDRFTELGFQRIEATSFSHPKYVPQFADAETVLQHIRRRPGVYYKATCVNAMAVKRALQAREAGCGPSEISVVVSASDAHSFKNVRKDRTQMRADLEAVIGAALDAGFRVVGTVGTAFGCPFTGEVTDAQVDDWVRFLLGFGITLICLGDTTGMGNPAQVERRCATFRERYTQATFIGHFHDTRGCGVANAVSALRAGVDHLDAAFGGLGGHPAGIKYAQGHTGNVCTEDLLATLADMGIETGIDLGRLLETARFVEASLGRELQGRVTRSGLTSDLLHDQEVEAFLARGGG